MDLLISTLSLGLIAAFCPISLAFLLPFVPKVSNGTFKRNILNSIIFTLGVIVVIAPVSFIIINFLNLVLGGRILSYIIVSCVALFMGLWTFRIIKIPRYGYYLKRIRRFTNYEFNNPFNLGALYGIITILRVAPLYITMLFLTINNDVLVGIICIVIYAVLISSPMLLLTSIISAIHLIKLLPKYSRFLDLITGSLLIMFGLYYILLAINLT